MVEFESPLILDGVCVRWRASIHQLTLEGHGRLELDMRRAEEEEQRRAHLAQTALKSFEKRLADLRNAILNRQ
jgi:hypothetical protein